MINEAQREYWNGDVGERWVERDAFMASLLKPAAMALLEALSPARGIDALDIGCGGGSQTLLLAERIGEGGSILGVDISGPLLECAREKVSDFESTGTNVRFLHADAAVHDFVPHSVDLIFSRFGVMFFDDPINAFANLRVALRSTGRVGFICWREKAFNDWISLPFRAIAPFLPTQPEEDPCAPGPFAFGNSSRVIGILENAGFSGVNIVPQEIPLSFGPSEDIQSAVKELTMTGPIAKLMADLPDDQRERAFASVVQVLTPRYLGGTVTLAGAVWLVTASK